MGHFRVKVGAKQAGCGDNGITRAAGPTRMNSHCVNGECTMRAAVITVFPSSFLNFLKIMTVTYSSLVIWQLIKMLKCYMVKKC